MLHFRTEMLKDATSLGQRMKIRIARLPAEYVCRSLSDFTTSQVSLVSGDRVLLPPLQYFPKNELDLNETGLASVYLRDTTRELEVLVDPTESNILTKLPIIAELNALKGGETIHYPILRIGSDEEIIDVYLSGFRGFNNPNSRTERPSLATRLRELFPAKQSTLAYN